MSKIIIVKPGDTLSKISRVEYGTSTKYMLIFSANPQLKSGDPNVIFPGEQLYIPDDPAQALADQQKQKTLNMKISMIFQFSSMVLRFHCRMIMKLKLSLIH